MPLDSFYGDGVNMNQVLFGPFHSTLIILGSCHFEQRYFEQQYFLLAQQCIRQHQHLVYVRVHLKMSPSQLFDGGQLYLFFASHRTTIDLRLATL